MNQGLELLEWSWLYGGRYRFLHHASLTAEQLLDWSDLAGLYADGGQMLALRLTCGQTMTNPRVPGIFSRMGKPRCSRCCDRLGYPRGIGSPKNDPAVRTLVEARLLIADETEETP